MVVIGLTLAATYSLVWWLDRWAGWWSVQRRQQRDGLSIVESLVNADPLRPGERYVLTPTVVDYLVREQAEHPLATHRFFFDKITGALNGRRL